PGRRLPAVVAVDHLCRRAGRSAARPTAAGLPAAPLTVLAQLLDATRPPRAGRVHTSRACPGRARLPAAPGHPGPYVVPGRAGGRGGWAAGRAAGTARGCPPPVPRRRPACPAPAGRPPPR